MFLAAAIATTWASPALPQIIADAPATVPVDGTHLSLAGFAAAFPAYAPGPPRLFCQPEHPCAVFQSICTPTLTLVAMLASTHPGKPPLWRWLARGKWQLLRCIRRQLHRQRSQRGYLKVPLAALYTRWSYVLLVLQSACKGCVADPERLLEGLWGGSACLGNSACGAVCRGEHVVPGDI